MPGFGEKALSVKSAGVLEAPYALAPGPSQEDTMLDSSLARLADLASMRTQFEENLLPSGEAARIAQDHRIEQSEEWTRAVYAALVGLEDLRRDGYTIAKS